MTTTGTTTDDDERPVALSEPVDDPFTTLPDLTPLRDAARAGDWPATQAFFTALTSTKSPVENPVEKPVENCAEKTSFASAQLATLDGVETYLERAAAEHPADPLPRTLLAERYIRIGWAIRSRHRAQHVSRDQFDQFHDWLRRAERLLIDVCAEQPDHPAAWTARLLTARGLELGQTEARRRYDRLSAHHPHHFPAQSQLLQQVCPKWSGSWEATHAFAQECVAAAPAGAHAGAVVAEAHIEHWADLDGVEQRTYMRSVSVRDELRAAARASVLHPDHAPGWSWIAADSAFAMAFSIGGHVEDAAAHFVSLEDRVTSYQWQYLPGWKAAFVKYRKSALATL
ncbi:hypothetical protein [Streptomyces sp. NBC_00989]|uniref:hypothetical protein n=1 Tax=Streptomyces sp. NBC_00989 TaxID=2903705 RepID=UPI00386F467E|nr:hypothetical protein OG714_21125 [Streptomyces sp. NBC_00989]